MCHRTEDLQESLDGLREVEAVQVALSDELRESFDLSGFHAEAADLAGFVIVVEVQAVVVVEGRQVAAAALAGELPVPVGDVAKDLSSAVRDWLISNGLRGEPAALPDEVVAATRADTSWPTSSSPDCGSPTSAPR
ncbi:hypothetical protein GCM10010172_30390 [Paractinoplanes ferrugineus]|uniref:Uncharacterized protein n=1 Tax=Paractinoplanes ferrugineus TaxID=113564 RepID=A0A919MGV8_9ACTN|nr:hypothetical protein [Actinoplanes ferrugineus]GIE14269.1 hypothetical protein Afe05nite_61090 [Actinoplanes ferrugineus]